MKCVFMFWPQMQNKTKPHPKVNEPMHIYLPLQLASGIYIKLAAHISVILWKVFESLHVLLMGHLWDTNKTNKTCLMSVFNFVD